MNTPLLFPLIIAALLGVSGPAAAAPPMAAGGFDQQTAFSIAGQHVPPERDSFYMFDVSSEPDDRRAADELHGFLVKTDAESDYIGIIGPNPLRTRRIFDQALDRLGGAALSGATVIYLGGEGDEEPLRKRVQATGAQFRFGAYP